MRNIKLFGILILLAVIIFAGVYYTVYDGEKNESMELQPPIEQVALEKERKGNYDYTNLAKAIDSIIADNKDAYSVFVARPIKEGNQLVINNQVRRSASMIKVFIMAYAMGEAANNRLDLNKTITLKAVDKVGGAGIISGWQNGTEISLEELIKLMITESDNTATNMLIDYLGMDNINQYIQQNGYQETILQRKMMDTAAIAAGRENYSSVKDLGEFFAKLVTHSCVNHNYDQKMIDILLQQTDTEVFPAAVSGVKIAHKTGELSGLYDDGGIVYSDNEPYVVVVMNDGVARSDAVAKMKKILQAVDSEIVRPQ